MSTKILKNALNSLRPLDQEILALRHFQELSNEEAATALEIAPSVAGKLYFRAMKRLTEQMKSPDAGSFHPFSASTVTFESAVG